MIESHVYFYYIINYGSEVTRVIRHISTGIRSLDKYLDGGLHPAELTLLYGEAESGKTTFAMQCSINCNKIGSKTLYIDSERTFMPERLSLIASRSIDIVSESTILTRPSSFEEQIKTINDLERYVNARFGLIVFDTITHLYRLELSDRKITFKLNRELNCQIATLAEIARTFGISVLLISQVRDRIDNSGVVPVATRVLKFWSDTIVRFSRIDQYGTINLHIEKRRGMDKKRSFTVIIGKDGIRD